jgi:elongation factor G
MPAPRPILSVTIAPLSAHDRELLQTALEEVAQTVPPFTKKEQPSGEVILAGESEVHLQAICALLRHDRQINIAISPPQVIYLETILKSSEAEGKYIRQTGGSGNYGHVKIRLDPQDFGAGIEFINLIHGGVIPEQYFQPIEQGIREAAHGGILASHEVVDFKATLYDGSHHEIDSNPAAFQIAASLAFKGAAKKADPIVIEPIMTTVFTTTERGLSDKLAEISSLRGRIEDVALSQGIASIRVWMPLREILGYKGIGVRSPCFSHYALANWPPDSDAAKASVRNPSDPDPKPRAEAASPDPDFDWT